MIKKIISVLAGGLLAACAWSGTIDGKWQATQQTKRGEMTTVLSLKTEGNVLLGTVTNKGEKREHTVAITEGKVEGDTFSFVVVRKTKQGEMRVQWQGSVNGDELRGRRGREGGKGMAFTAKRI